MLFLSYIVSDTYLLKTNPHQNDYEILCTSQYLVLFVGLTYLIISGFPMLSEEPHVAKLQVSQYPILIHLFRNGSIFIALWLIIARVRVGAINNYLYLCMIISILTAFKGYVVPYILLYIYVNQKSNFTFGKVALLFLVIVITIEILFGKYGGLSIDGFTYIFNRLTEGQIAGSIVLMDNYQYIDYVPLVDDIFVLLGKFFDSEVLSLQQELYQIYHSDVRLLELSNLWFLELYLFLGGLALLVVFLIVPPLYYLYKALFKSTLSRVFIIYSILPMADGVMNGKIFYKFMDYILSALIIFFLAFIASKIILFIRAGIAYGK